VGTSAHPRGGSDPRAPRRRCRISRWQDITVNGQQVAVQIPVDNIDNTGSGYGAQFPFAIWASFMGQMQHGTPFAGDPAFTAPSVSPTQSVMT
jgi:hypothetical protein